MRDVEAFATVAHAPTLNRLGQDDTWPAHMFRGGLVGGIDLGAVVSATAELLELLVRVVLDHLGELGIFAEEVFADVSPGFDDVFLVLPVDDLFHAFDEAAILIPVEQGVPIVPPNNLKHVPARATEVGFELLDHLTVAPYRSVQSLQVAVDDKDEVVQFFACRQGDGAQGLGLVTFTVPDEGPDFLVGALFESAVFQVFDEAGVVDGGNRPQSHGYRRELPELGHQPGMGVGGESGFVMQFVPEIVQLLGREPAFQEGSGVDARRAVALEIDQVTAVV